jgi:3',5'-cyclic AMP phosphodiesterase CpdA
MVVREGYDTMGMCSLTGRMHWIREALDKMVYIILGNHDEAKKSKIISLFSNEQCLYRVQNHA